MTTTYTNFYTITTLQQKIMRFIDYWAHTEKIPISQKKILDEMESKNESPKSVTKALNNLLRQGYIRKAITSGEAGHSTVKYVQLRSL